MNPDLDKITEVILKVLRAQDIELESKKDDFTIPVGVSNHHVHLTEEHIEICSDEGLACGLDIGLEEKVAQDIDELQAILRSCR